MDSKLSSWNNWWKYLHAGASHHSNYFVKHGNENNVAKQDLLYSPDEITESIFQYPKTSFVLTSDGLSSIIFPILNFPLVSLIFSLLSFYLKRSEKRPENCCTDSYR